MPKITFISHDGIGTTVDAVNGDSVMATARANNIDGITAECGGEMMCATCHAYVDEAWIDKIGPAPETERDMLELTPAALKATSRLSCQIKMTPDLDGLVVRLPESQV